MEDTWIHNILLQYGLHTGTFVYCFISGFLPIVNAEIFLVFISSISTKKMLIPILILSCLGQMTAKTVLYFGGKGSLKISHKRYEDKINQAISKMKKWESKVDVLIFISAMTGFPPFYIITITSGIINHNFLRFFIAGCSGRLIRFGILLYFPQLFKDLFA